MLIYIKLKLYRSLYKIEVFFNKDIIGIDGFVCKTI